MKDIGDRVETYNKRAGTGVLIVCLLLLSAALSWADITVLVEQADTSGALTVQTFDSNGNLSAPIVQQIPNSCYLPQLFWDSGAGALRLNGFNEHGKFSWTGTIAKNGQFALPPGKSFSSPDCSSLDPTVPADAISAVYPDKIPCVSYTPWSTTCSDKGFFTRTGIPDGCEGDLLIIPCSIPPTCTWNYGDWTPAPCVGGTIQTRTATGCLGFPDDLIIRACPPQLCTGGWQWGPWTPSDTNCTPGVTVQKSSAISGTIPTGCTGGILPADQTKTCPLNPCTGGWVWSDWAPSDTTCTPGVTVQKKSAISGTIPTGCSGGALPPDQTKTCPSSTSSAITPLVFGKWPPSTQHFSLTPDEAKVFKVTAPACTTTRKELKFSVVAQQSMPTSHVLVKKVNGNPSAVPTRNDYDKFKALTGGGGGPYVDCGPDKGDGTCDSTGNFFWSFSGTSSLELTIVYSSYLDRLLGPPMSLKATAPNFKQGDDYYLYVVNTGPTKQTEVYLRVYCD